VHPNPGNRGRVRRERKPLGGWNMMKKENIKRIVNTMHM
jgi:hypothetical protein